MPDAEVMPEEMKKNYKMLVEIPITNVPDKSSKEEVEVTSRIWLAQYMPGAKLIKFEVEESCQKI